MSKAGLVLLGAAPGVAAGYLLLAGYLLNKVRPIPITIFPEPATAPAAAVPPMYRRATGSEPETPREPVGV